MQQITKPQPYQVSTVTFNESQINVYDVKGVRYVPMRHICEAIGLDWSSQYAKIKQDVVLSSSVVEKTTVSLDGMNREMVLLEMSKLNGWLFKINPSRVKPEIKEVVIKYQRECYDVLYEHFQPKQPLTMLPNQYLPSDREMTYELAYRVKSYHVKNIINIMNKIALDDIADLKNGRYFIPIETIIEAIMTMPQHSVFRNNEGKFRRVLFNETLADMQVEHIIEVIGSMAVYK